MVLSAFADSRFGKNFTKKVVLPMLADTQSRKRLTEGGASRVLEVLRTLVKEKR